MICYVVTKKNLISNNISVLNVVVLVYQRLRELTWTLKNIFIETFEIW